MARKSKVAEVVEGGPTVEEQLAAVAAGSTPAGIEAKPPILAVPTKEDVQEEVDDNGEEGDEDETAPKVPIAQRLGEVDEDDLRELFGITGIAERLQKAAEERAAEVARQERERIAKDEQNRKEVEDREFLRRLRKTDPVAYNEELDKREAADEARKQQVQQIKAVTDEFVTRLGSWVEKNVDPTIAGKFKGKDYSQLDLIDGVLAYIGDIVTAERSEMRPTIEKELDSVLRKKILTEINGNTEEAPQPTTGSTVRSKPSAKLNFQTEYELAEAFAQGKISKEQMLEWYKTHGIRR